MEETLYLISEVVIGEKMFRFNDFSTLANLIIKNVSLTLFCVFKGNLNRYAYLSSDQYDGFIKTSKIKELNLKH